MAIRKFEDVPSGELIGKFVCLPSPVIDQHYGWPAQIQKVTARTVSALALSHGEWIAEERRWAIQAGGELDTSRAPKSFHKTSQVLVCDTAEEAYMLHRRSVTTHEAIQKFRKDAIEGVLTAALNGTLSFLKVGP